MRYQRDKEGRLKVDKEWPNLPEKFIPIKLRILGYINLYILHHLSLSHNSYLTEYAKY